MWVLYEARVCKKCHNEVFNVYCSQNVIIIIHCKFYSTIEYDWIPRIEQFRINQYYYKPTLSLLFIFKVSVRVVLA